MSAQYSVTDVWSVPYVGTVVNGIINCGTVKTGDAVMLGPDSNGNYLTTSIKSMQRKRLAAFVPGMQLIDVTFSAIEPVRQ